MEPIAITIKKALDAGYSRAEVKQFLKENKPDVDVDAAFNGFDRLAIKNALEAGHDPHQVRLFLEDIGSNVDFDAEFKNFEDYQNKIDATKPTKLGKIVKSGAGQVVGDVARGITTATFGLPEQIVKLLPGEQGMGPVESLVDESRFGQGIKNKSLVETGAELGTSAVVIPRAAATLSAKIPQIAKAGAAITSTLSKSGKIGKGVATVGKALVTPAPLAVDFGAGAGAGIGTNLVAKTDAPVPVKIGAGLITGIAGGIAGAGIAKTGKTALTQMGLNKSLDPAILRAASQIQLKPEVAKRIAGKTDTSIVEDLVSRATSDNAQANLDLQRILATAISDNQPATREIVERLVDNRVAKKLKTNDLNLTDTGSIFDKIKSDFNKRYADLEKTLEKTKLTETDVVKLQDIGLDIVAKSEINGVKVAPKSVTDISDILLNTNIRNNATVLTKLDTMISDALRDPAVGPFKQYLGQIRQNVENITDGLVREGSAKELRSSYREFKNLQDAFETNNVTAIKNTITKMRKDLQSRGTGKLKPSAEMVKINSQLAELNKIRIKDDATKNKIEELKKKFKELISANNKSQFAANIAADPASLLIAPTGKSQLAHDQALIVNNLLNNNQSSLSILSKLFNNYDKLEPDAVLPVLFKSLEDGASLNKLAKIADKLSGKNTVYPVVGNKIQLPVEVVNIIKKTINYGDFDDVKQLTKIIGKIELTSGTQIKQDLYGGLKQLGKLFGANLDKITPDEFTTGFSKILAILPVGDRVATLLQHRSFRQSMEQLLKNDPKAYAKMLEQIDILKRMDDAGGKTVITPIRSGVVAALAQQQLTDDKNKRK